MTYLRMDHAAAVRRLVRLCNAITEALREMEKCPDDSVQDIWNESLESWETGLRMDHNHNVEPNRVLSNTETKT
jgi:hypothetical protein